MFQFFFKCSNSAASIQTLRQLFQQKMHVFQFCMTCCQFFFKCSNSALIVQIKDQCFPIFHDMFKLCGKYSNSATIVQTKEAYFPIFHDMLPTFDDIFLFLKTCSHFWRHIHVGEGVITQNFGHVRLAEEMIGSFFVSVLILKAATRFFWWCTDF